MVHSTGVASNHGNKLKQMISQAKTASVRGSQGPNEDSDSSSDSEQPKKKKPKCHEKRFVEPQVYIKFSSNLGCSIQVRLELPESRDKINKMNLKNQKAEMQRKFEEVEQYFTVQDPYYREMLQMVKEKKRKNREFAQAIRNKQIRELIETQSLGNTRIETCDIYFKFI